LPSRNINRLNFSFLWIFSGMIVLSFILRWFLPTSNQFNPLDEINILVGYIFITYIVSGLIVRNISFFPGKEILEHILILVSVCFGALITIIIFSRGYYLRLPILLAYSFTLSWFILGYYLFSHKKKLTYGLIALGDAVHYRKLADSLKNITIKPLNSPEEMKGCNALIADFHATLSPQWIQFIAQCHMNNIPVYDYEHIYEVLTGKVNLANKDSIHFETRYSAWEYLIIKRVIDFVFACLLLPVFIPIIAFFALLVKLESRGPAFFIQRRTGIAKKTFYMVKLRSMYHNKDDDSLTVQGDRRITKIGWFIRKTRIDEMPQIFNVLKGEMSFIGPRPEYVESDNRLRQSIPHYDYRYLVRPGISGWAQVGIGHVTGEEATREKLEMDIYYVKNVSIWLDFHIVIKTIKVMFTGYGSK
jgi:lipopolysaccharide/colanic/teichoic acid biosynthesis glycosyltransferase